MDYNWREFEGELFMRFPANSNGHSDWTQFVEMFPTEEFTVVGQPKRLKCPRVFISHKQIDEHLARRIAWLAVQEKFEFWLDVLDPSLQAFLANKGNLSPIDEARITAAIIEMGLINCTHVIAVITKNARPSRWIPYEYGRVKDSKTLVDSTASWISKSEKTNFPEYLHLGNLSYTELELRGWLRQEFIEWNRKSPESSVCNGGNWTTDEPTTILDDAP